MIIQYLVLSKNHCGELELEPNPPLAVSFPILKFPFPTASVGRKKAEAWQIFRGTRSMLLDATCF